MLVKFLGHSAIYFEAGEVKGLIDPFLNGNPQATDKPEDFNDITHIFVTHGHGDHLGDTVELAKRTGATVIANFEIINFLATKEVNGHPMHIGGRKTFPFGTVKMTPALHGSGISDGDTAVDGGNPGGFVIEIDGKKLYHAGDTGLTMDMQLLEIEKIDLALLPIGGNFTMDIRDAAIATSMIKPLKVAPIHYNTWEVIDASPEDFISSVSDFSEGVILKPGEEIKL